ncbi:DUF3263 domain-containing protein [Agromyces sp. NPDC058136]|uniref:DUF3263 domain-containing protein n=1 Tax=Agromyces sp. NPDC058136 TaxID=3346354 RepID=UPI0036DE1AD8
MLPVAVLLALETAHPQLSEAKRAAIRKLGVTGPRYFLDLTRMLANTDLLSEALRLNPTTTHRLLRQRDERAETRKARR